jgi:hypothetical protein
MSTSIRELLPGVAHWTTPHPNLGGAPVNSYYLLEERVLIDPFPPPEDGAGWFDGREPRDILLSNRHHLRGALELRERFGATVRAPEAGMSELSEDAVTPYAHGGEVLPGVVAHHVLDDWPDETALELRSHRALVVCDAIVHYGELGHPPDQYLGEDPDDVKRRLKAAYARLVEEVDFDHALFAHGEPIVGGARERLKRFCEGA